MSVCVCERERERSRCPNNCQNIEGDRERKKRAKEVKKGEKEKKNDRQGIIFVIRKNRENGERET